MIHFILLSGGSGTRLWPLSNKSRSKQFLKVLKDVNGNSVSMVQRVFSQIEGIGEAFDVTIATIASQKESIKRQVDKGYKLVLEPERRDTAAAIMLACANLRYEQNALAEDTVIVMPIDTYADQEFYSKSIELDDLIQSYGYDVALLGAAPTYPSEKYGYIVPRRAMSSELGFEYYPISEFKEKPTAQQAERLISEGAVWNCGVFAFRLQYLLSIIERYIRIDSYDELVNRYSDLPRNSFDYEVVEGVDNAAYVLYEGYWKDLGTWNTLSEEMTEVSAGRVVVDADSCENVHVINETGLPMVVAGMKDVIIVCTPDGILVSDKISSVNLKKYVEQISETRPMYEVRRWGEYRVLDSSISRDGSSSLVKELIIDSGKQLSYQRHCNRSEIWNVVSGKGQVVLDDDVIGISAGSVVRIERGQRHSCRSFDDLHIIEVQLGDILAEDDIERFGDYWQ